MTSTHSALCHLLETKLAKEIGKLSVEKCEGCINGYPGQRDHDCLMLDKEEQLDRFFDLAWTRLEKDRLWRLLKRHMKSNMLKEIRTEDERVMRYNRSTSD